MRSTLVLAAMLAAASGSGARAAGCDDPVSQAEMNRCAAAAFQKADAALNQAYADFLTRLRGDAATTRRLREAQRAWIDFRDKQCAFEGAWAEGGTVQPFVVASCMTVATRDRTEMLRRYLECEEGDLSCLMPAAPR